MKLLLVMKESIYDCKVEISDARGSRSYLIPAITEDADKEACTTVDIYGSEAELSLIPSPPDANGILSELEEKRLKDKLIKKAVGKLLSMVGEMPLRVGCRYPLRNPIEDECLTIILQTYAFGTFDRFNLLGLYPMMYLFFEVSSATRRLKPECAWGINRKSVLKAARAWALGEALDLSLLSYPIQVGRIKRLTRDRKVNKKILKFSSLSETGRQAFLKKQAQFL